MSNTRFTEQQIQWWSAYEEVRDQGLWNMFDRRAQEAAGLAPEEYIFVMENYSALRNQANEVG